jgi:Ca2+-binding RTX toxin-like protein
VYSEWAAFSSAVVDIERLPRYARNDTLNGGTGTDACHGGPGTDTSSGCEITT